MNNPTIPSPQRDNDLDLAELFSVILYYQKWILGCAGIVAFLTIIYSFSLPNLYQSSSKLKVYSESGGSDSSSAAASALGSLSSLSGISLGGTAGSDQAMLAIATIQSRDFFKHLIETDQSFLANLFAVQKFNKRLQVVQYHKERYNIKTQSWVVTPPSYVSGFKDYLNLVQVKVDKKTKLIEISLEHESPQVAFEMLSLIIKEANILMRERQLQETNAALQYLYGQLKTVNQTEILNSINSLITSQLKKLTFANVRTNFILDPVDSPFIPDNKSSPARARMVIFNTIAGFLFATFLSLIWHFALRPKQDL